MAKIQAVITGVQGFVPDYVLDNDELATMVDTNDEWITTRTGIKERRILKGEKATSDMAVEAVKGLLEKTNTTPDEIDLLVCATVTGDMVFPDTANIIRDKVGIKNGYGFDINAACSGFIFSLDMVAKLISTGGYKKAIVVGADKMSSIVDYTDRATCVIFGDGAGAVLLEPTKEGLGIQNSFLRSDGQGRTELFQKAGGSLYPPTIETVTNREHFITQHGRTVYKFAVSEMSNAVIRIMKDNNLSADDIAWLVPHQANIRIIETTAKMAKFPMEKVMVNIQKYGNTTNATIPLCLWEWEKQLKKGDNMILTAFGGGFTWGSIFVKWGYDGK